MKAWLVREKDEFCSVIVFALTRGKAKSEALSVLEDADFRHLEATRFPFADSRYNGNKEPYCLDWTNPEDRLFLVKDCGWHCEEAWSEECRQCVAKEYCAIYEPDD